MEEYEALILGLKFVIILKVKKIKIFCDSKLFMKFPTFTTPKIPIYNHTNKWWKISLSTSVSMKLITFQEIAIGMLIPWIVSLPFILLTYNINKLSLQSKT